MAGHPVRMRGAALIAPTHALPQATYRLSVARLFTQMAGTGEGTAHSFPVTSVLPNCSAFSSTFTYLTQLTYNYP